MYIPRILWRLLSARAGLDVRDIIEAAHSYKSVEKFSSKSKIMEYIVENIDQYASNPRRSKLHDSVLQKVKYFGESLFCGSGIYLGNYLVTTYFFIKLVYLVNSISQFFIMNEFLGKQFHELGLDILRYLTNTYNSDAQLESVYFPKVVMCDFRIREFGHPNFSHRYTIQCVLPINLYNQQIFTFLWFWFLILFCANMWALVQWVNRMLPSSRRRYVNRRLNMLDYFKDLNERTSVVRRHGLFGRLKKISYEAKQQKRRFIDDYLKFDGVFILRMISSLTSEIVCKEILHELWTKRAICKHEANSDSEDLYTQRNSYRYGNSRSMSMIEPTKQAVTASQRYIESFHQGGGGGGGAVRQPSMRPPLNQEQVNQQAIFNEQQRRYQQQQQQQRMRLQSMTESGSQALARPKILRSTSTRASEANLVIKNEMSSPLAKVPILAKLTSQSSNSSFQQQQQLLHAPSIKTFRNQSIDSNISKSSTASQQKQKRVAFVASTKDNEFDDDEEDEEEEEAVSSNVEDDDTGDLEEEEEDEEEEAEVEEAKEKTKKEARPPIRIVLESTQKAKSNDLDDPFEMSPKLPIKTEDIFKDLKSTFD